MVGGAITRWAALSPTLATPTMNERQTLEAQRANEVSTLPWLERDIARLARAARAK